jgi:glutathione S-transferase
MRILWGVGTSRTMRPHWAFHELDLDFECRPISPSSGETRTAEFTALTARQKIPLFQDNELVLTESAAIIWYLSETYGQDHNRLIPTDPRERARCLEWCFFILGELDETSLYVMRRHSDMQRVYGEAPAAIEAAATYFRKQMRTVERALRRTPITSWASGSRQPTSYCRLASPGRCTTGSPWRTRLSRTMLV